MNTAEIISKLNDYGADTEGAIARFVGNEQLYCSCVMAFFKDENMEALKTALERGNIEAAFSAAHTLKGLTGNLGFTPLYDRISYLAELLRAKDREDVFSEQETVFQLYDKLKKLLLG